MLAEQEGGTKRVSVSDADMFRAAAPSQQRPSAATLRKVLPSILLPRLPVCLVPSVRLLLAPMQCRVGLCHAAAAL